MTFTIIILVLAGIAFLVSLFDLWYTLSIKNKILHTLEKIELEQKKVLFENIYLNHSSTSNENSGVVDLARKIKQAICLKLKLKQSLTYPQLIRELESKGVPADLKELLSDFFNRVMRIEYSYKKEEDTDKIIMEAKEIIKRLGLNLNTTAQSK